MNEFSNIFLYKLLSIPLLFETIFFSWMESYYLFSNILLHLAKSKQKTQAKRAEKEQREEIGIA